jgi:hypothetical protein
MSDLRGDLQFEIIKKIGVIGQGTKGWSKEVNVVRWNNRRAKLDIRDWSETHEKMGKGVTLSFDESRALKELLADIDLELELGGDNGEMAV